jgi:hypothetical protein
MAAPHAAGPADVYKQPHRRCPRDVMAGRTVADLTQDRSSRSTTTASARTDAFANEIQPIIIVKLLDRSTSMRRNFGLVRRRRRSAVMLPADKGASAVRIASRSIRAISLRPRELVRILPSCRTEPIRCGTGGERQITALLHQQGRRACWCSPTAGCADELSSNSSLKGMG